MVPKKTLIWLSWGATTLIMITFATYLWKGSDKRVLLPGKTTHGHHQIEISCSACHTPWMGVKQEACYDCHEAELKLADDTHPRSKFNDPRNADRLALIQADDCVTCHREHQEHRTGEMGVTMPADYCYHCHQQTLTDRPSHANFAFDSCATAGCHNYHDNTALYESFLLKHLDEPDVKDSGSVGLLKLSRYLADAGIVSERESLAIAEADAPSDVKAGPALLDEWHVTAHARAGINCSECHSTEGEGIWSDAVDHASCSTCHKEETDGFLAGKHGMRLAQGLSPMTPADARIPMHAKSAHKELNCVSCHGAHEFDTRQAAVESCLQCHNDEHSLAYKDSPHFELWLGEVEENGAHGRGVSCATCHMPREKIDRGGEVTVRVQHNQNTNLRPNEKMIRSVCMDCHGLGFSINALADADLVKSNFTGRPSRHIESIDLARQRQVETQQQKSKSPN